MPADHGGVARCRDLGGLIRSATGSVIRMALIQMALIQMALIRLAVNWDWSPSHIGSLPSY